VLEENTTELIKQKELTEFYKLRCEELLALFKEGFNSGSDHDLEAWEVKVKTYLQELDVK